MAFAEALLHREKGINMKKTELLALGLLLTQLTTLSAHANTNIQENDPFYQVGDVRVEVKAVEETPLIANEQFVPPPVGGPVIPPSTIPTPSYPFPFPQMQPPGATGPLAIIDLLFKAWNIVKDGAPVVNIGSKNASALPYVSSGRWEVLSGWKSERSITYRIVVGNVYGIDTVDFEYKVNLIYGGNVGGKGKYIASARVIPSKVDVLWGYNLDVTVEVPNVYNVATPENPVAAITLDVNYKVSTILRSTSYTNSYELRGDGTMKSNGKTVVAANACLK
jgi:hypothetical protein